MNRHNGQEQNGIRTWKMLTFALLVAVACCFYSDASSDTIIPDSRRVQWDPGVRGDIPNRTTIFANVKNAPYGAVADGVTDATKAIQSAITACPVGQVVYIPSGTYKISSTIKMKSGVTLRGDGMGLTVLKGASPFSGSSVVSFESATYSWDLSSPAAINITGGLAKGSTSITTSAAHGWSAGDLVVIDQVNNPTGDPPVTNIGSDGTCTWCGRGSGGRSLGQMNRVTAVPTSTTATLENPLYWDYNTLLSPQGVKVNGVTSNAGVEGLSIDNSASGSSTTNTTIKFSMASNCWLYQVEGIGSWVYMVRLYGAYQCTIRSSKFHEGVPATPINGTQYGSGRGYGISFNPWASANLIENNELYNLSVAMDLGGVISGNVIAYNYLTSMYYIDNNWERGVIITHGGHATMNLFEGNMSDGVLQADFYWGSSSHNTYFRNRHFSTPGKTCGTWDIGIYKNSQYYNFVGNVLGTSGFENTFELAGANYSVCPGPKAIYMFGFSNPNGNNTGSDPQVKATVLRHGNFDYVSKTTLWDSTIADQALPPSLYLSSKPAWWTNVPWPAIGPDVSPMYPAALALGTGTPWGGAATASSGGKIPPPASLKIQ